MESHNGDSRELPEAIDETGQPSDSVAEKQGDLVLADVRFDQRRKDAIAGGGRFDKARAIEIDRVLATAGGKADPGRVAIHKHFEMVVELRVQHLLRGCEVEWVESGVADKGLGDHVCPGIPEAEKADSGLDVDGRPEDFFSLTEFGQDRTVEMEIEVEASRCEFAVGNCCDRGVDQATDGYRKLCSDSEKQCQLIFGVNAGHGDDDLVRIRAADVPDRFQMGVSEIGGPQETGERSPK
jgi:hypothetical protein